MMLVVISACIAREKRLPFFQGVLGRTLTSDPTLEALHIYGDVHLGIVLQCYNTGPYVMVQPVLRLPIQVSSFCNMSKSLAKLPSAEKYQPQAANVDQTQMFTSSGAVSGTARLGCLSSFGEAVWTTV